jgi:hypothetical protein
LSWLRAPLLVVAICAACVVIHELGHVAAATVTGGSITNFVVFSARPHITVEGQFTAAQNAFKSVAGSGLLLLVWAGCIRFVPLTPRTSFLIELVSYITAIELFAWVLSSSFYPSGPNYSDVTKFIRWSGMEPRLLTAVAIAIGACGVLMYRRRVA